MGNAAFSSDATGLGKVDQIFEQAVAWAAGEQEEGTASTDEDTALIIDNALLLSNDSDLEGNALAIASVASKSKLGAEVSINVDGDIVYNPTSALQGLAAGELACDSFWYEVSDGKGGTDTATVNVTVAGLADPALGDTGDAGLSLGLGTLDADVLI
jgi:VCBS repeat-containing protein